MLEHRRDNTAFLIAADFGVIFKTRGHPFHFVAIFDQRLAAFERHECREVFAFRAQLVRDFAEHFFHVQTAQLAPTLEGGVGSSHGFFRIRRVTARHGSDDFFCCRVDDIKTLLGGAVDEFAIDPHLGAHEILRSFD
ncbi:MAG: hypothetical protein ALAOOOJD_02216 [bacterium]|nr:hypothetical protein [Syntrophorhabdaceae bacterium]MCG3119705.1 hypothetical protein [bacterium]